MKYFFVVLFVFVSFVSQALAYEAGDPFEKGDPPYDAVIEAVDLEVTRLSPSDRAVVDKVKEVLGRANEKELEKLRIKIKSDPAWKIVDEPQRAFWQEVINIASIYLWQDDCLTRGLMISYYSRANHMKVDEECARNLDRLMSTFPETKLPIPSPHEDCRKEDPVAVARFDQELTYFFAVYNEKYKCHCGEGGGDR